MLPELPAASGRVASKLGVGLVVAAATEVAGGICVGPGAVTDVCGESGVGRAVCDGVAAEGTASVSTGCTSTAEICRPVCHNCVQPISSSALAPPRKITSIRCKSVARVAAAPGSTLSISTL